jgi:hypothetical protein
VNDADLAEARWRKSSYSNDQGECVEVAFLRSGRVAVRDSKDRGSGPTLLFTPAGWSAFVRGVVTGDFER